MSACTSPSTAATRAAPARTHGVWFAWLARMVRTVSTRGHLAEMDDRMLRDVGLDPIEARREMMRKPWDV
ncbi:DUF1127 domain-containing protein [Acetobacteraceae bacterium H6797]|nr:DUF1127 domain-containing protein [Acetobacteraceae bacterium H6797]